MLNDRIEAKWIDAFETTFQACKVTTEETAIILSESQSRDLNVHLAELALARMGVTFFHVKVPTPPARTTAILRSTGMSLALDGQNKAVDALKMADFIVDLTVEGLMHARQTGAILGSGARVLNISNEHPEMLERAMPDEDLKARCLAAARLCRTAELMRVESAAGTDLTVSMAGNNTVGVWGWTDKPGTLAHWPGGIVVSFPAAGSVNGKLVFQPGDMNLTFKRYFESEVTFDIREDYVTAVQGKGTDARLMRAYFEAFGDKEAYATSHVGWGLHKGARHEALTMYGRRDLNGTELRAVAGNFLYSTGANEFAGRFTEGHFDLPMMGCTISVDGTVVVDEGVLVE
ncbi:MAG: peptidase M29 [Pseudomonadota bacterium]